MKKVGVIVVGISLVLATLSCSLFNKVFRSDELVFSPDQLPAGQVGQAYEAVVSVSNQHTPMFEMNADENSLPPGLTGSFDKEKQTFTISGTPTQAGTFSLKVNAMCYGTNVSGQTGEKDYELVIK